MNRTRPIGRRTGVAHFVDLIRSLSAVPMAAGVTRHRCATR